MSLKRFIKKIFGQGDLGKLKYRVVSPGRFLQEKYFNSTGYFFDEEISGKGKQPDGVWFIGGGDKYIDVAYDVNVISKSEIEKFIKSFGIDFNLEKESE